YVASFAGFAPINNPEISVVVVLDTPIAPTVVQREGGWVAAPVFRRIAQQVLEYRHTPHDIEIPENRQLLARAKSNDKDLEEGSPDHPGEAIDSDDASDSMHLATSSVAARPKPDENASASTSFRLRTRASAVSTAIVPTALRESVRASDEKPS